MALKFGPRQVISNLTSSVGISATILIPTSGEFVGKKCQEVTIQARTKAVYVSLDGAAADTTGLLLNDGDTMTLKGYYTLTNFRAIESEATGSLIVFPAYVV